MLRILFIPASLRIFFGNFFFHEETVSLVLVNFKEPTIFLNYRRDENKSGSSFSNNFVTLTLIKFTTSPAIFNGQYTWIKLIKIVLIV